jgi:hypothetical protein
MLFPFFVANPYQQLVKTEREFEDFLAYNNGKNDCFRSHNAYADPQRKHIWVQVLPFDYDNKEDLTQPHADMQALAKLGEEIDVPTMSVSSGRKGFHSYLCFKPMLAINNTALKDYYKAAQMWAIERASLKSWDKQIIGDTNRQMRIPGTIHPKTGKWCRKIDPSWSLEYCQSLTDKAIRVEYPEGKETFLEFCKRMRIRREMGRRVDFAKSNFAPYDDKGSDFDAYLKLVLPRMCIHNALMTKNPPHSARLQAIITLAKTGYDMAFTTKFIRQISEHYDWENRDPNVANYFVEWQFRHPGYHDYSCKRLREEGLCVGKACDVFAKVFPEEVTDDVQESTS